VTRAAAAVLPSVPHMPHVAHTLKRLLPGIFQDQVQITLATWLLRRGAGMETVKECLGHASITTTIDTYGHLTVEDARQTLEAAGWFTGREVRL